MSIWRISLRGLAGGIIAAIIGSFVLGLLAPLLSIILSWLSGSSEPLSTSLIFSVLLIVESVRYALLPSAAGGIILACCLYYASRRSANLSRMGSIVGGLVGGTAGVVSFVAASHDSLYGEIGSLFPFDIFALAIAIVFGGIVGTQLAWSVEGTIF